MYIFLFHYSFTSFVYFYKMWKMSFSVEEYNVNNYIDVYVSTQKYVSSEEIFEVLRMNAKYNTVWHCRRWHTRKILCNNRFIEIKKWREVYHCLWQRIDIEHLIQFNYSIVYKWIVKRIYLISSKNDELHSMLFLKVCCLYNDWNHKMNSLRGVKCGRSHNKLIVWILR